MAKKYVFKDALIRRKFAENDIMLHRYVNELVELMRLPQSTISRHLGVLRDRSLVDTEREGTAIQYFLTDKRIIDALDIMRAILATQLEKSAEIALSLSE